MEGAPRRLVTFVLRATGRLQVPLVLFSLLTLPAAWFLLDIPKHIINFSGHPDLLQIAMMAATPVRSE